MLVLRMAIELAGRRLQDVGGRRPPRGHAPAIVLVEKSGLGLSAGKAELAGVARDAPGGVIGAERLKTLGDATLVEPFNIGRALAEDVVKAVGADELDRAGAIFADVTDQGEGVARRHLKASGPAIKDRVTVRQKAPQERLDRLVVVPRRGERHG